MFVDMRIPHLRTGLFVLAACLLALRPAQAQQIDLSLHATAVPDSFEIRATSTGAPFSSLPNGVFSIRWEVASGGVMANSDLRRGCQAYSFFGNTGTTVDIGPYRYFTVVFFGERTLEQANCPITSAGMSIGGVRIRELSGCRNVALVQNAFTGLSNLDYYISMGGIDVTGDITSDPISAGDCPPCVPPVITGTSSAPVPYCGVGVDMGVTATGTDLEYAWYKPNGSYFGWLPQVGSPTQAAGTFTIVVYNACGADTAEVVAIVDPNLCEPPVLDSVWYHQEGPTGVRVRAAVDEPCITVTWTMPWGAVIPANNLHTVLVNNPVAGIYTAIVQNACGSDTMELDLVPPVPCSTPTVNASITAGGQCATGTTHFAATVTGPGPILSQGWYAPNGAQLTGVPNFNMGFAPWGTYYYVATNLCGSDTANVFHGGTDTTGLADCTPPEIMSVGPNGHSCYPDTVRLFASYVNDGPCAQVYWSGINILSTNGDTIEGIPTSVVMSITATNACGQVTMQVPFEIWHPQAEMVKLCFPVTSPLSLDSLLALHFPYEGGVWFLSGAPHSAYYDPAVDTTGQYFYHLEVDTNVVCPVARLTIHEPAPAYAGEDSTVHVCSSAPPFTMIGMLGGVPMPNGHWSFNNFNTDGEFDPATDLPGVYRYTKIVGQFINQCIDDAYLTINVEEALPWYADTDGDGLGDALDSLLSCDPVEGHVANGEDACPQLFGTVGDPCDDGDPATNDEVITEDCACIGGMGIDDGGSTGGWQLWPNPARGVVQLQGPSGTGALHITVVDASGREVLRTNPTSKPITLHTEQLAPGTYSVHIRTIERTSVLRLVVR